MSALPTAPGYYWAKLKTPSGGTVYNVITPSCEVVHGYIEPETDEDGSAFWASQEWEIVRVNENDPNGDPTDPEHFSVDVFGIPVTQWPLDFFWGPIVNAEKPA